jgi:hypothetical protein
MIIIHFIKKRLSYKTLNWQQIKLRILRSYTDRQLISEGTCMAHSEVLKDTRVIVRFLESIEADKNFLRMYNNNTFALQWGVLT